VGGFVSWWDGVELWLTGQAFVLQTVLVMPVVLLLAYGLAVLFDGLLGRAIAVLRRVRGADRRLEVGFETAAAAGPGAGPAEVGISS
jgi:hypothetical protein